MKIKILKRPTKKGKIFDKEEWLKIDLVRYGKTVDWTKHNFILEVYDKREVIGILHIKIEAGVAYIGSVIVGESLRGKGIGQSLITKAEQVAKENKAHKIYLMTGKSWGTVKFYEDLGYKEIALLKNHYVNSDFVQMEKFL